MIVSDWINSVVALATVFMAAGTFYLACATHKLAKDTAEGAKQTERHHQENLRPFCVIVFDNPTEQHPFGSGFSPQSQRPERHTATSYFPESDAIRVRGEVQNKGKGPATDILLYLNMRRGEGEAGACRLTRPVVVSGLIGAEDTFAINIAVTDRDIMHIWNGKEMEPTQVFSAIPNDTYEIVLEYKDVFGNTFRTVHPRGIWTAPIPDVSTEGKRLEMMTRQNRPTPIFLTGRQAARGRTDFSLKPSRFPLTHILCSARPSRKTARQVFEAVARTLRSKYKPDGVQERPNR